MSGSRLGGCGVLAAVAGAVPRVVGGGVVGPRPGPGGPVAADREAGDLLDEGGAGGELAAAQQGPGQYLEPGPTLSDAELVTLAVMQALPGFTSEARWLRHARAPLRRLFPCLPQQPGYSKRLRAAASLLRHCIRALAANTSVWTDDVWVVDSTPVECGRSRETARRSDLAGWAEYGYCASHSRYFWGLRLHMLATLHGLPVGFALTGAKADERQVLLGILDADPELTSGRAGQILIGDKNYFGADFEAALADAGLTLLRPARKGEAERGGSRFFKPLRQTVESIFDTYKDQIDLERHGGRTPAGVLIRVLQRIPRADRRH